MSENESFKFSRRNFIRAVAGAAALPAFGGLAFKEAYGQSTKTPVFRVDGCPVHDNEMRHIGLDSLLFLLSQNGVKFFKSNKSDALCGPNGIIAADDVVLLKVNCQWKARGTTNTDMLRGLIQRILQHPDGFKGEVVIFENGQNRPGSFNGIDCDGKKSEYNPFPELKGKVKVNAEQDELLTVDYLVNTVFKGKPVSTFLLDPVTEIISADEHTKNGYRKTTDPENKYVSYPCFTTAGGNRIELKEGRWTGKGYAQNVKLIHCPVLKDHSGDIGMTGALKIVYGTLLMKDGSKANRHYADLGSQCAKMWTEVRAADLTILDCIWVSFGSKKVPGKNGKMAGVSGCIGYPPELTNRQNILLAGLDPVAIDYHANKHILHPLGGETQKNHDPDNNPRLVSVYSEARDIINKAGGINGMKSAMGDENIQVIKADANDKKASAAWSVYA